MPNLYHLQQMHLHSTVVLLKQAGLKPKITSVYANLKLGQLAHRKLGQYQYN